MGAPGHHRTLFRVNVNATPSAQPPPGSRTRRRKPPRIKRILRIIPAEAIKPRRQIGLFSWRVRHSCTCQGAKRIDGEVARSPISVHRPKSTGRMLRRIAALRHGWRTQSGVQRTVGRRMYAKEQISREDYFERRHMPSWWYRIHVDDRMTIWVLVPLQ